MDSKAERRQGKERPSCQKKERKQHKRGCMVESDEQHTYDEGDSFHTGNVPGSCGLAQQSRCLDSAQQTCWVNLISHECAMDALVLWHQHNGKCMSQHMSQHPATLNESM
jgi:hypothetical protein